MKDFIHERDESVWNFPETKRLSSKNLSNFTAKFRTILFQYTRLERLIWDNYSSLLAPLVIFKEIKWFFWFKWVLDRGPEQRESKMTVFCLLIIIILISKITIYYIVIKLLIMENHPSRNQKLNSRIKCCEYCPRREKIAKKGFMY